MKAKMKADFMNASMGKNISDTAKVAAGLEKAIRCGSIKTGERLDRIRSLAAHFDVGMTAVMRALDKLEKKQLIVRRPRSGVFAAEVHEKFCGKILIVCYETLQEPYYMPYHLIPEIEKQCMEQGLRTERYPIALFRGAESETLTGKLRELDFSGVLLCGSSYTGREKELDILRSLNIPVVLPSSDLGDHDITGFAAVENDRDSCWKEALSLLKEKGFTRIGAIGKSGSRNPTGESVEYCVLGCRPIGEHFRFMRELGLTPPGDSVLFLNRDLSEQENRLRLETWLEDARRFDAVLCYSGFNAALLYQVCRQKGIRIPEDLAVISADHFAGFELLEPSLTAVGRDCRRCASEALDLLQCSGDWYGKGTSPVRTFPPEIHDRESTIRKK